MLDSSYAVYLPRRTPRPACPAVVRRGRHGDCAAGARLITQVAEGTEQEWTERLMRDVDGADRDLIVAVVDDELAGYTRVGLVSEADPSGWWVVGLVVAEPLRRKGIGEALLRAAAQHVTSRADVLMSCYDRANGASADLHRAVGFVVVRDGGTRFPGYAPDNPDVTVRLELAPS